MKQSNLSYAESVEILRSDPTNDALITASYLDRDTTRAAVRFASSEEFAEVLKLLEAHDVAPTDRILDIGCGNGIAVAGFLERGFNAIGLDPDGSKSVGLGAAAALIKEPSRLVCARAESLPYPDASFKAVYARQCLHHFGDLERGVCEIYRVLKPNGVFLATREHVVASRHELDQFLQTHPLHRYHGGENAYSVECYNRALRTAGFVEVQTLASHDCVINHFPISNQQIRTWLVDSLTKRFGSRLAEMLAQLSIVERLFRRRLSRRDMHPGRMYSFIGVKR